MKVVPAAAGEGDRSLLAWSAQDGGARRIELLALDASGASEARWITDADHDATSPAVAMGPDGSGLVAWVDGMPLGRVTAMPIAPDGTLGPAQALDTEGGGHPEIAVGPDGAAVAAWP